MNTLLWYTLSSGWRVSTYPSMLIMIKSLREEGCQGKRGVPVHLAAHNTTTNLPEMSISFLKRVYQKEKSW